MRIKKQYITSNSIDDWHVNALNSVERVKEKKEIKRNFERL